MKLRSIAPRLVCVIAAHATDKTAAAHCTRRSCTPTTAIDAGQTKRSNLHRINLEIKVDPEHPPPPPRGG